MRDPWKIDCVPWTEEPTGSDVGYFLRTSDANRASYGKTDLLSVGQKSGRAHMQWPSEGYVHYGHGAGSSLFPNTFYRLKVGKPEIAFGIPFFPALSNNWLMGFTPDVD